MRPRHRLIAATALLALAVPASAGAAERLTGKTSQDRRIVVRVGDDGQVTLERFGWVARCTARGFDLFDGSTKLVQPMAVSTPTEFSDRGSYSAKYKDGSRARVTISGGGLRNADGSWAGTFRVERVVVRRNGRRVGTCRSREITWSVR